MNYGTDYTCEHGEPPNQCTVDGCKHNPDTEYLAELDAQRDAAEEPLPIVDRLRARLLDAAGLDSIPEPEPLIRGVLQRNSLAWLFGKPGDGKTFVALDMSGSVGTGQSWQGFPVRQGPVLYIIAEGAAGIRQRVRAWESGAGRPMTGVTFLPVAVQANHDGQWSALCELAAELRPALIVIDTQARTTLGLEENSAKDMGAYVDRLERLRVASGACVLNLHHTARGNGDHVRGSTAVEGAATTIVRVKKEGDCLTLSNDPEDGGKQKDHEPFAPIMVRLIPHGSSVFLSLTDRPQGTDLESRAIRAMIAEWWNSHETDWVSVAVLIDSRTCTKTTFHRAKKALLKAEIIERTGQGNATRYRMPKDPSS